MPILDQLPELAAVPANAQLVIAELDRFLATCPPSETPALSKVTPAVQSVQDLLRGRSLVLIGDEKRPGSHQAILKAFGLKELLWLETRAHASIESFQPYVARGDVAAVLLAIRWSSHSFGEVRNFCEIYDKPLVRLPGGYSPNQVAAQIMAQCSERLAGKFATETPGGGSLRVDRPSAERGAQRVPHTAKLS